MGVVTDDNFTPTRADSKGASETPTAAYAWRPAPGIRFLTLKRQRNLVNEFETWLLAKKKKNPLILRKGQ